MFSLMLYMASWFIFWTRPTIYSLMSNDSLAYGYFWRMRRVRWTSFYSQRMHSILFCSFCCRYLQMTVQMYSRICSLVTLELQSKGFSSLLSVEFIEYISGNAVSNGVVDVVHD